MTTDPKSAASSCDQPMRGIYGATTICARPAGHVGKHDPIWNHEDWPEASSAASPLYRRGRLAGYAARLRRLSPQTKYAIKLALEDWVATAQEQGYEPISGWDNFSAEVHHSALLDRLLSGKLPLVEPPPKRHSYPDYEAVEGRG